MSVRLLVSRCPDLSSADAELFVQEPVGEEFLFETELDALSALPTAGIESLFKNGGGALIQDRDHDRIVIHIRHIDPDNPRKRLPFSVAYLYGCGDSTTATLRALLPEARKRSHEFSPAFQQELEELRADQEEEEEERKVMAYRESLKMQTPPPKEKFKGRGALDQAMRSLSLNS